MVDITRIAGIRAVNLDGAAEMDFNCPFVVRGAPEVSQWCGKPEISTPALEFGTAYKKMQGYNDTQKANDRLLDSKKFKTLSAAKAMFATLCPGSPLDLGTVSPTIAANVWITGTSPDYCSVGMVPNGSASLRIQIMGEVQIVLLSVMSLKKELPEPHNAQSLAKFVEGLTTEKILELVEKSKLDVQRVRLHPLECLYVPVG